MKLNKPDKLFFFTGAAGWIPEAIGYAREKDIPCYVFAVTRHLNETYGDCTFREELEKKGILYYHCDDINTSEEFRSLVTPNSIGIGLGEAYTFTTETLELIGRRIFDFMTIRMPRYRGGAHFTWQILQQNRIGAWYIQLVNEAMIPGTYDQAEIIKTHEYIIPQWARTPADYFSVADAEGLKLFKNFTDEMVSGKDFQLTWLQENFSLYLPRLYTLRHGLINWNWTGDEIERFICAFDDPYQGASTFCNGKRVSLKKVQLEKGEGSFHPFMNGLIYRIFNKKVFVAVASGTLIIENISDETGTSCIDSLHTGDRLYTPQSMIDDAMLFNAEFDSKGIKNHA
jgi:hypothetical protein